ncbi:Oidioi.mRNA.OKI2018_I69.chr2.g5430.t1.cds [Oikopleura dioica]|uniref:Oidioi.mRNA.OKI2018_I69.chr2.g5430.t1.cds n=1 Tax=Oikopleura dioica TaxID=34765 RepID=A0ABN7T4P6_OIKDI|nr:Oidioi.mRNA.OKI2018_I69.chr2.g5430.t1.cds [Oikopleura dioica]
MNTIFLQIYMIANMNNISWGTRCSTSSPQENSIYEHIAATKKDYFLKNTSRKFSSFTDPLEEQFWAKMLSAGVGHLSPLSDAKKK